MHVYAIAIQRPFVQMPDETFYIISTQNPGPRETNRPRTMELAVLFSPRETNRPRTMELAVLFHVKLTDQEQWS